jgi:hypothetical protein
MKIEDAVVLAQTWRDDAESDATDQKQAVDVAVELVDALYTAECALKGADLRERQLTDERDEAVALLQLVVQFRRTDDGWHADMLPGCVGRGPTRIDALTMAYTIAHRRLSDGGAAENTISFVLEPTPTAVGKVEDVPARVASQRAIRATLSNGAVAWFDSHAQAEAWIRACGERVESNPGNR